MMLAYSVYVQAYLIRKNDLFHDFANALRMADHLSRFDVRRCFYKGTDSDFHA
ncbi:hypothetical protein D1872_322610 [compost metagenome]